MILTRMDSKPLLSVSNILDDDRFFDTLEDNTQILAPFRWKYGVVDTSSISIKVDSRTLTSKWGISL